MRAFIFSAALCCLSALGLAGTGCSLDATSEEGDADAASETVGQAEQPFASAACNRNVYEGCFDQLDSTGSISVRIYMCKAKYVDTHGSASCAVESDRVLVSGGGNVEGNSTNIGAFLTNSFGNPMAGGSWWIFSKDHFYTDRHSLRPYAVGLKLKGYSASQLQSVIHTTSATMSGPWIETPGVVAIKPQNEILLGGGAITTTNGPGQLLTALTPTNAGWVARSKAHLQSSVGTILAQSFSMPSCPPGLGYCLAWNMGGNSGAAPTGNHSQAINSASGRDVFIAAGGQAFYNGAGRMMVGLVPYFTATGTAIFYSKDHYYADTGTDGAAYVSLRRL